MVNLCTTPSVVLCVGWPVLVSAGQVCVAAGALTGTGQ